LLGAGVLLIRNARAMPRLGARYEARKTTDTDSDLWQALSDGQDPT